MNSQDITRALIDTTVARAMVEMDADPKRSVRKLCDLGRQFSRGRFQNQIFAIFQDLLRNDESPYYQAIDFLLRSNDPEALRQFGINIGYNSFTYGAQILRQKQKRTFLCCSLGCQAPSRQPHPGHLRFLVFCIRGQNRSDIRHLLLSAPLHGSS